MPRWRLTVFCELLDQQCVFATLKCALRLESRDIDRLLPQPLKHLEQGTTEIAWHSALGICHYYFGDLEGRKNSCRGAAPWRGSARLITLVRRPALCKSSRWSAGPNTSSACISCPNKAQAALPVPLQPPTHTLRLILHLTPSSDSQAFMFPSTHAGEKRH